MITRIEETERVVEDASVVINESLSARRPVITRRDFLASSVIAGGGLILSGVLHPTLARAATPKGAAKPITLNAWVRIGVDDVVTIVVSQAEMGQGVRT